jgi:hypothetical protein
MASSSADVRAAAMSSRASSSAKTQPAARSLLTIACPLTDGDGASGSGDRPLADRDELLGEGDRDMGGLSGDRKVTRAREPDHLAQAGMRQ